MKEEEEEEEEMEVGDWSRQVSQTSLLVTILRPLLELILLIKPVVEASLVGQSKKCHRGRGNERNKYKVFLL